MRSRRSTGNELQNEEQESARTGGRAGAIGAMEPESPKRTPRRNGTRRTLSPKRRQTKESSEPQKAVSRIEQLVAGQTQLGKLEGNAKTRGSQASLLPRTPSPRSVGTLVREYTPSKLGGIVGGTPRWVRQEAKQSRFQQFYTLLTDTLIDLYDSIEPDHVQTMGAYAAATACQLLFLSQRRNHVSHLGRSAMQDMRRGQGRYEKMLAEMQQSEGSSALEIVLILASLVNALLLLAKSRLYRIHHSRPQDPMSSPNLRAAKWQDSVETSVWQRLVANFTFSSREGTGAAGDIVELRMWDPQRFNLIFFRHFSPLHALINYMLLAKGSVFSTLVLLLMTTIQMSLFERQALQLVKDKVLLAGAVANEYERTFVAPRLYKFRVDASVQTDL